jgi:tetratricopeptide (TPR) repeat protein
LARSSRDAISARNPMDVKAKIGQDDGCGQRRVWTGGHMQDEFARAQELHREGRFADALALYGKAIEDHPGRAEPHLACANVLMRLKRYEEAAAAFGRALAIRPDDVTALCNRGWAFKLIDRWRDSVACYERALTVAPDDAQARFALCMAELPLIYSSEPEVAARRSAYERRLGDLCREAGRADGRNLAPGVAVDVPFRLAYQGLNDRELQRAYGTMVCRIMAECYPPAEIAQPPGPDEPVRVGIVGGFFREHTVWKLFIGGWLTQLDRRKFQLFGYHTADGFDFRTAAAKLLCHRLLLGSSSVDEWRAAILQDRPHVLIYPGLFMERVTMPLAAQRLAPVQCAAWGHPETSGLPTIDYFLSSDLMEPADGQDHYTERLVRLPNLSIHYEPVEANASAKTRAEFGLRDDGPVFWCGQSLFKYLPQYDQVLPRIAREVPRCQFAFIAHETPAITEQFRARIGRAFAEFGLAAADYCVFMPQSHVADFLAGIRACDIVLDSIGWSGGNSTLETLEHDRPIVTVPGALMRGRHTAAILRMMGVTETIADDLDGYIRLAVRLARDGAWRAEVAGRIAASKARVYGDRAPIAALQEFLDRSARRA